MLLLSLDTSTRTCSVALHKDQELLLSYELNTDRSSASMLTPLIEVGLNHAGVQLSELDAVAIAMGPGSYTGLRVGVATAKGLCYASEKPLIAINTLKAMAKQIDVIDSKMLLCPMLDARRMEVYCAVYDTSLNEIQATRAEIVTEDSFIEQLNNHPVVFFGEGSPKCKSMLGNHPNAIFVDRLVRPSAKTIGELAHNSYLIKNFVDLVSFEPFYLKDFMSTKSKEKAKF